MPEEKNLKVKATEDRLGAYVYSIQEEDEEDEVMHARIDRGKLEAIADVTDGHL